MTTKNLVALGAVAVVLGGGAYFLNGGAKSTSPKLNGKQVLPGLDVPSVARVEIGDKLVLSAGKDGWVVDTWYGYPADRAKIAENLLKLQDLKVGQVVRGKKIDSPVKLTLKGRDGKELVGLELGEKHSKWGHGRYAKFDGETVLVSDALDAFDGEPKQWCNTRIASITASDVSAVSYAHGSEKVELDKGTNGTWTVRGIAADEELDSSKTYSLDSALSYLDFNAVVDPKLTEAELGFSTGSVYTVTFKEGSNTVTRVATVGNKLKDSSDRYFKLDNDKWVYAISSYSAENMMKTRKELVKAKAKPEVKETPAEDAKK